MHSGVETVWRYVLKTGFIIFERDLVKKIKTQCQRCRYWMKKVIDVEMGPISKHIITIAPAFYLTQANFVVLLRYTPCTTKEQQSRFGLSLTAVNQLQQQI